MSPAQVRNLASGFAFFDHRHNRIAQFVSRLTIGSRASSKDSTVVTRPLAASFSSAAVKQEQRIRFDSLRRVASPQVALRRFNRRPDPLRRIVG
jgi:hypothetical protein